MVPPEYERVPEDWGDYCAVEDDRHTRCYVLDPPDKMIRWSDEVRERVVRRSRGPVESSTEEVEGVVFEWAPETTRGRTGDDLTGQFKELASVWRSETRGVPFVISRSAHWAYQRIIGMGPRAVPLILQDLSEQPDHWYWALNAITGEDPAEGVESFDEAAQRWLDWGRFNEYIS